MITRGPFKARTAASLLVSVRSRHETQPVNAVPGLRGSLDTSKPHTLLFVDSLGFGEDLMDPDQ